MKYFYDTEYLDNGETIEFISIGMVAEDGREYYAVTNNMETVTKAFKHPWLKANVMNSLPYWITEESPYVMIDHPDIIHIKPKAQIAQELREFILRDGQPQLWAYFAAYDHVVLSQLFGKMLDLPLGMPMWSHDLMQEIEGHGNPWVPTQLEGAHNALSDARWNKSTYEYLQTIRRSPEGFAAGPIANPRRTRAW